MANFKGVIYFIANLINGKVYVGQTTRSVAIRFRAHREACRRGENFPLYRSVKKYGWASFEVREVVFAENQKRLDALESAWIILLRTTNREFGYNLTYGGNGGARTEEVCEKLRRSHLGQKPWNKGMRSSARKIKLPWGSAELHEKLSNSAKARTISPETRKKISETLKKNGCVPPWNLVDRNSKRMSELGRKGAASRWGG